jgi:hypothetical protein
MTPFGGFGVPRLYCLRRQRQLSETQGKTLVVFCLYANYLFLTLVI